MGAPRRLAASRFGLHSHLRSLVFYPDPDGEYKVRIWQDYQYSGAGIDYTAMSVEGSPAPLLTAWDHRYSQSCYDEVVASDNYKTYWSYCPRDRIVDLDFDGPVNFPPTTDPVTVDVQSMDLQIIYWTYQDREGDPQAKYEVEVWSGSGGSGSNMWDPPAGEGEASSIEYAGEPLTCETDYYARVRAQDGTSWGPWADAVFQTPCNAPPVCSGAIATPDELWPPNHKYRDVSVAGVTDPDGDPVAITITAIFQDEPLNARGDGNTCPDGAGVGTDTASVRAERSGNKKVPGDGRVYHVGFMADDGQGGQCTGGVTVCVPHDQRPGHVCVDQGSLFDSTSCP